MSLVTLISDSFNRADGSANGSTLDNANGGTETDTWTSHVGTWTIATNQLKQTAAGADEYLVVDSTAAVDVQRVSMDYVSASTQTMGVLGRWTPTGSEVGYMVYIADGNTVRIYKHAAGFTQLANNSAVSIFANDVFSIDCSGSTIQALQNGNGISLSVTDTDNVTGRPGIYGGGAANVITDNFKYEVAAFDVPLLRPIPQHAVHRM